MDQSSNFTVQNGNKSCVFCCLPMLFLISSNEYNGENITNLTLEPDLVNYDTFKSLVEINVKTFTRNWYLANIAYENFKKNSNDSKFTRISNHEAYPVISELCYHLLIRFAVDKINSQTI